MLNLKLSANKSSIKNKSIILIDDSLVRGTTCHKIVKMLYDAGAKEVHVRIASRNKISRFLWYRYAFKKRTLSSK